MVPSICMLPSRMHAVYAYSKCSFVLVSKDHHPGRSRRQDRRAVKHLPNCPCTLASMHAYLGTRQSANCCLYAFSCSSIDSHSLSGMLVLCRSSLLRGWNWA